MFVTKYELLGNCLLEEYDNNKIFLTQNIQDVKIHYVSCGDEGKPLMLCLHGFPEFWYSWRYQLKEFSKEYRVVAVDMRGYGDSDKPSSYKEYTYDKLSKDIKQIVPALGYSSCVLMSHDWGGALAWQVAAKYPEIIDRLVVFNAPHPATFQKYLRTSWTQFKKSWYMYFFQVPFVPELMFRSNDLLVLDKLMHSLKHNKPTPETVDAYKYTFAKPGAFKGPMNYYRAAFTTANRPFLTRIQVPTLLVWGDPDMALNTELAELAKEHVDDITVKIIPNSNHFVMLDTPNECNAAVWEFLKKK